MEKNINFSLNTKVLAAAALGAGILVGASAAYVLTRIHEHSNLTHLVSRLHTTIIEVKEEITHLETELGLLQRIEPLPKEKLLRARHRKAVSFSSNTSTSTYRTAAAPLSDRASFRTARDAQTDSDSWKSPTCDTDYFSPGDEEDDDDEFFDIVPSDNESDELRRLPQDSQYTDDSISEEVSDLAKLIRKADSLMDGSSEEQQEAYYLLKEQGSKYIDNSEILWRKAKATNNMAAIAEIDGNLEEKKEYIEEAYGYAEAALNINDKSAENHKWFAIMSGARGEYLSTKERIANGHVFKKHIDIALQISPNDSMLHHLQGRFCFEVSLLSWVEKKIASAVFGEVPSASFEEALEHFLAAEELKQTGWKDNRLFIAKCYFKLSKNSEGEVWLRKALRTPTQTPSDEITDKEIYDLMRQYSIDE